MDTEMIPAWLDELVLLRGSHESPESGLCFMEAAAYLAGREHSDKPPCVSAVIGTFVRTWNDRLDYDDRQKLKRFIPLVLGTAAGVKIEERRRWMAADWLMRIHTPAWLELAGIKEAADALRALPEVCSLTDLEAIRALMEGAGAEARAIGDAAWAAIGDATCAAWRAAAWDAARDAIGDAVQKLELQKSAEDLLERMIGLSTKEAA